MQFAIIGDNSYLAKTEMEANNIKNIKVYKNNILLFDDIENSKVEKRWSIIKMGRVIELWKALPEIIEAGLVWVNEADLWKFIKKKWIRRYKEVELKRSDREIIKNWIELILLDSKVDKNCKIWIVDYYQDISLFEKIDFEKPQRWMQIWMMPSKLALTLINIATWLSWDITEHTVYDPFAWFWTTNLLCNWINHHSIWSDLKITAAKENLKRWSEHYGNKDKKMLFYKHDVMEEFNKSFLDSVTSIVTEWWLWPIIKKRIHANESIIIQKKILEVYMWFLKNVISYFKKVPVIVMTVPYHIDQPNIIASDISDFIRKNPNLEINIVEEVYKRKKQNVWRQIIIIKEIS